MSRFVVEAFTSMRCVLLETRVNGNPIFLEDQSRSWEKMDLMPPLLYSWAEERYVPYTRQ